ncbi:MaoC family dehydratase [Streptomyces sp. NPDC055078]
MTETTTTSALPTATSRLLGRFGWFEDFSVGQRIRHSRASTIGEIDGSFLAKQVMNTAQAHWNDYCMEGKPFGPGRVVFGLATASTVLGLASEDTVEHAIAELALDGLRFTTPVHHGDTLEAFTEVIEVSPAADRPDAGVVRFKHWGRRQEDRAIVFEGIRTVLVKRRSHWAAG